MFDQTGQQQPRRLFGKSPVDRVYDLIVIVPDRLKLIIKIIQTFVKTDGRIVYPNDFKLSAEQPRENKTADIFFAIRFTEHLLKADIFVSAHPERVSKRTLAGKVPALVCCIFHILIG